MCTVIGKEGKNRVVILSGINCCLSVEQVTPFIPKVDRSNGWKEIFVGDICKEIPYWAKWLSSDQKSKALEHHQHRIHGKPVYYYDVADRCPYLAWEAQ